MKVVIALASSSGQLSGVQRHAINLSRALLTRQEVTEVHFVAAPWQQEFVQDAAPLDDMRLKLHSSRIGNKSLSRNLWFYKVLPKLAAELSADIVHLAYPVPMRRRAFHCPTVVTLHDMYPYDIPDNFGFPKVLFNRAVLRTCLESVDAIACVSQSTLSRLQSIYPTFIPRRIAVIPNSVELSKHSSEAMPVPHWGGNPFLLCVAQHRGNKNILLVLQVFERLLRLRDIPSFTRLVIVGIRGPETPAIQQFIASSSLEENVVMLNGISDAELQWCYRNCALLLAPSKFEGFGLPVAEALLAGCRVVCSDIPVFRELAESNCHFVPLGPEQINAFAEAVRSVFYQTPPQPIALPKLTAAAIGDAYIRLYLSCRLTPAENTSSDHASVASQRQTQPIL
jgi:glycosyltransferase involved in cell wall biosynthesis